MDIKQTSIKKCVEIIESVVGNGIFDEAFFLSGPCGIGKTTVGHILADKLKLPLVEFRPAEMEAIELVGAPWLDEKTRSVEYFRPDVIPTHECVFLIDELTLAATSMYSVLIKLVRERELGGVKLHPKTVVIATGNRVSDRAGVNRISSALRESFVMFDVVSKPNEWLDYYAKHEDTNDDVWNYIAKYNDMLCKWDGKVETNQPCPRNWMKAGKLARCCKGSNLRSLLSGIVGKSAATAFMSFIKEQADTVTVEQVLAGEKTAPTHPLEITAFRELIVSWLMSEHTDIVMNGVTPRADHDKVCDMLEALGVSEIVPAISSLKLVGDKNEIIKGSKRLSAMLLDNMDAIVAATK